MERTQVGPRIHLAHCKASETKTPGARQKDAYEVLGQARKCIRWLYKRDLFEIMKARMSDVKRIQGTIDDFERLVDGYTPQTSLYAVHVVQPGFDIPQIQRWHDPSIRVMFLSVYDDLRNLGVEFHIFGS